jgi:hypothetical protein
VGVAGGPGFLLDRWGRREENGDMSFLRALGVTAIVTMTASLVTACGDDGTSASGFSNGTEGSASSASSGSSGSSGGVAPTTTETTEAPTGGTGTASGAESSTSTSAPGTTSTTGASDTTTEEGTTAGSSSTTSPAACGNGIIDGKEQCDGADLNGFDCVALGNAGGTLLCDSMTCTFDTQMCDAGGGGTTG